MDLPSIKNNPGFQSDEELVCSFVVRLREFKLIVDIIRENTGPSNQHVLVVGPRGAGKTMLVRRIAAEARADPDLAERWYPLVFPEETYEVLTPGEFWLEALSHLADQTGDARWRHACEDLRAEQDDVRLRERALAQLMDFADGENKRLLFIVENLNMLMGEQLGSYADWDLRHTLQNEPRLMLLGTATTRFDEIENAGKAWFEGFSTYDLEPLNAGEYRTLWKALSGQDVPDERLRPVQILTGGNPRLLTIFAGFAAKRSFRELMEQLIHLIDTHTEYFKSQLDGLAPAERKVFAVLLEAWDPVNARQISKAARMEVNKASALLHRLASRGIVTVMDASGRRKWYQAAERLYNVYYLLRRRNTPSSRVRAVVRFMVQFYEKRELVQSTVTLAEEAVRLTPEMREDHYWAYREIIDSLQEPDLKREILQATPANFFVAPDVPDRIRDLLRLREVYSVSQQAEQDFETAEKAYREAIEQTPQDAETWAQLGQLLHKKSERFEEAEAAYRQALALNPKDSSTWMNLGMLLHMSLKRSGEAEQAYRKAIELNPKDAAALSLLGYLQYDQLGQFNEAEQAYKKAIEINSEDAWPWTNLGGCYENLKRFDEAEQAYRKAIEINPEYAWAWLNLGELLMKLERFDEAEQAHRRSLQLDPEYVWSLRQLTALQLAHSDNPNSAIQHIQQYLDDTGRKAEHLDVAARILSEKGSSEYLPSAETWAREAVATPSGNWKMHHTLVTILAAQDKWEEALVQMSPILAAVKTDEHAVQRVTERLIAAAAAGHASDALKLVAESDAAPQLEPLEIGLRIFMGETPRIAQEILEIGQDVARRIREREK